MSIVGKISVLLQYNVAITCAFTQFFLWSTSNNQSLIFVALYSSLEISRAQASWPFNLTGPATIFGSVFAGVLSIRFSTKFVILFGLLLYCLSTSLCFLTKDITAISVLYGFLKNAGFHVIVTVLPALITGLYQSNRVTVMGMQHAGGALASFVFPAVSQFFLDTYDIRSYFLLIGAVSLNGVAVALLIRNRPCVKPEVEEDERPIANHEILQDDSDISTERDIETVTTIPDSNSSNNSSRTDTKWFIRVLLIFKTIFVCPIFYLLTLTTTAKAFWSSSYDVLIADFMSDCGIDSSLSVSVLTACGVGQLIGYIALGWIVDKKFLTFEIYLFILTFLNGLLAFILTVVGEYWMFMVFAVVMGFMEGAIHSVLPIMFRNCLTQETLTFAIGISSSFAGLVMLSRESLIDYFRDTIGSYKDIFILNGGVLILMSLTWPAVHYCKHVTAKRRNEVNFERL